MLYRLAAVLAAVFLFCQPALAEAPDNFAAQRRQQDVGRVVVDPAGRFIIYEWRRPYDWRPSDEGLPRRAAERPQTTLYRVAVPDHARILQAAPTSYELFPPNPGASYYLGYLSPDASAIGFYEIDRDTNALRAGAVRTSGESVPEITWFVEAPDAGRLQMPAQSQGGQNWIYPVSGGWARADAVTGQIASCSECYQRVSETPMRADNGPVDGLPRGARLAGASADGVIAVYVLNSSTALGLYYVRRGRVTTVFENRR